MLLHGDGDDDSFSIFEMFTTEDFCRDLKQFLRVDHVKNEAHGSDHWS